MNNLPFTIKWMRDGGISYFSCVGINVEYRPSEYILPPGVKGMPAKMDFDTGEDGFTGSIDSGVVYILNATGKTIDTINFPLKEGELGDGATARKVSDMEAALATAA